MKIMKKWLAIGLAVAMLTGLSACGNENQDSSRQQESSASEESGKSEESSAPQESSTEEAGGSEAKEPVLGICNAPIKPQVRYLWGFIFAFLLFCAILLLSGEKMWGVVCRRRLPSMFIENENAKKLVGKI